jgi:hypothetical protein
MLSDIFGAFLTWVLARVVVVAGNDMCPASPRKRARTSFVGIPNVISWCLMTKIDASGVEGISGGGESTYALLDAFSLAVHPHTT